MKVLFIGNVELSARLLEKLFVIGAPIAGVVTKESSSFNADHVNLSPLAGQHNVPCFCVKDIKSAELLNWVKALKADVCYCFGFSHLLSHEFLSLFPYGAIGYHPAALPRNRGRHPVIWALALGLEETASTFFYLTVEPDAGDIVSQVSVPISYEDDARTLSNKLADRALIQIEEIYRMGSNGTVNRRAQVLSDGNLWRKRSKDDGKIDFRMGSKAIYNLVRALTRPYVGAHLCYQGQEIKVWKVREEVSLEQNIEPGKILEIDGSQVLVKCYEGAVWIVEHDFSVLPKRGEYCL